jgi:alpha,alpha-trehalose phosphorylase
MIRRQIVNPPTYVYPDDDWSFIEARFYPRFGPRTETIFALSNGYFGIRGTFDEGRPVHSPGTFVNGFFESWPIVHAEEAYGFAKTGQTIVNVTDCSIIRLYVDDEPFFLDTATILSFRRVLDMRSGTLEREVVFETPAGARVKVTSSRLVSFQHRHLAAISYDVTVLDAHLPVVIASEAREHEPPPADEALADPRKAREFQERVLTRTGEEHAGARVLLAAKTRNSDMRVACGIDHAVETDNPHTIVTEVDHHGGKVTIAADAAPNVPVRVVKYLTYHTSRSADGEELCRRGSRTLDRAVEHGYQSLRHSQRAYLDDFWRRGDVLVDTGQPRVQRAVRWNLFQIIQNSARAEHYGVPAKGLTGQAYDGHYFWDIEMYVMPFLVYSSPRIAKNLVRFRYGMLDLARQRARELNQRGALFPWRTISGEEASAYYEAGTAQYHIDADIIYALKKYVLASGDRDFLYDVGAEMLVETARLWRDLGFFQHRDGRSFHINGVTGPDEYTTVVNNNTYTNLMARKNLRWAAETLSALREERPDRFAALVGELGLSVSEIESWRDAGDHIFVPYDEELGIHLQDDAFLQKAVWDFESTPADHYPLLLHYHPLVIYRFQVIKQADIVLAMFLFSPEFSQEQKKRNFDYYDPLTTGDSSLSACVQSIVAAEVGYTDRAYEYFQYALFMDLADVQGNTSDGVHVAAAGGVWMALVHGFAGMRDDGGRISFYPRLPQSWRRVRFALTVRGEELVVDLTPDDATYLLRTGDAMKIAHRGEEIDLLVGEPVTVPNQPATQIIEPPAQPSATLPSA